MASALSTLSARETRSDDAGLVAKSKGRPLCAGARAVQGLAGEKLLCDLTLELDAVNAVLGHGLSSFESPA